jgi:hypothetical protein
MSQAIDYFDIGMLDECHTRLKIILKIWPKNEQARYLLGLTCVCGEETEEALKYLNYVDGHYQEQAQRLIRIIESGMSELVVKKYLENTSLFAIENEIKEILL